MACIIFPHILLYVYKQNWSLKCEVFTAVNIQFAASSDIRTRSFVDRNQLKIKSSFLLWSSLNPTLFPWRWVQQFPPKYCYKTARCQPSKTCNLKYKHILRTSYGFVCFFLILGVDSILGPLCGHYWPIVPAPGDCEYGEAGGMNGFDRGNRSTRRKPATNPTCQTRARTRAAAVGSQHGFVLHLLLTLWTILLCDDSCNMFGLLFLEDRGHYETIDT
jgi:hypothetical protein